MGENKSDVLQGTLDLMVLKTLESMGPQHGYGIARRIEQVSGDELRLNQGTIYPALLRLQQRGWIKSEWGTSESNRRAKYYSLSRTGRRQIDDRQPPMSERRSRFGVDPQAVSVRPPMDEGLDHCRQAAGQLIGRQPDRIEKPGDSAHRYFHP